MSYFGLLPGDLRRRSPRVATQALCTEFGERDERHSFVVDMSATGIRVERPYDGGRTPRTLQLEFELPGVDELIWARGDVCFDRIVRAPGGAIMRRLGLELSGARAELAMLRDWVFWKRQRPVDWTPPGADEIAAFTLA